MGALLDILKRVADSRAEAVRSDERNELNEPTHGIRALNSLNSFSSLPEGQETKDHALTDANLEAAAWNAEDWQGYYLERCGIRQFESGLPRALADHRAWRETANRWWHQCGERVPYAVCVGCREPIANADGIPLPYNQRVHDASCMTLFGRRWLADAAKALRAFGIEPPEDYLP